MRIKTKRSKQVIENIAENWRFEILSKLIQNEYKFYFNQIKTQQLLNIHEITLFHRLSFKTFCSSLWNSIRLQRQSLLSQPQIIQLWNFTLWGSLMRCTWILRESYIYKSTIFFFISSLHFIFPYMIVISFNIMNE